MSSITSRLKERDDARRSELEQRRAEREKEKRVDESSEYLTRQLEAKKETVTSLLQSAEGMAKEDLPSHFDKISSECQDLQKLISDATIYLTDYDKKNAQQQMTQLLYQVFTKQEQLLSKKKFTFRSRKKESTNKPVAEVKGQEEEKKKPVCIDDHSKVIKDKENEVIEITADEATSHDVHLSCLKGCKVKVYGGPLTLQITQLTNCSVLSGPISGSVFIEDCRDCNFVVACQQLRLHSTIGSQLYLHVTSRAVIEDSRLVSFAPYTWTYPHIEEHFKLTGLDRAINNWDKVDDFNWLSTNEPSPNWTILQEDKRVDFSDVSNL